MALYKQEKPIAINAPCHAGFISCERILISNPEQTVVELGYKHFHCVRRLSERDMLPSCPGCVKDMHHMCFKLRKCYDSPALIKLLIEVYLYNAKIKRGGNVIWWDSKWYAPIVTAIKYPVPKEALIDYHTKLDNKEDDIVSF